ncbi:NEDD4-binding protein 2-like 1 [Toxocara canis]|uniref:NEDD4-binding protein 2-like 1 n=1 Tax=Toxocara canis TaxID=6265 RepID=A0A0B2UY44_TOXCA|nr:NEDD4-binding protein 2-like 1 [Toxocara canis]
MSGLARNEKVNATKKARQVSAAQLLVVAKFSALMKKRAIEMANGTVHEQCWDGTTDLENVSAAQLLVVAKFSALMKKRAIEMANGTVHEQCWDGTTDLENVKRCIRDGHSVLILMRGVPGSGKSYLARELLSGTNGVIHSTDDYFTENGVYTFDATKLQEFHQRNFKEARKSMSDGVKLVIIDNTNIYSIHMKPYVTQAIKFMYEVYFVEPQTQWKTKAWECARFNTHAIPEEKISYLLETFEIVSLTEMIKPVKLKLRPPLEAASDEHSFVMNDFAKFYAGIKWSFANAGSMDEQRMAPAFLDMPPKGLPVPPTDGDDKERTDLTDLCGGTGKMVVEKQALGEAVENIGGFGGTAKNEVICTKPLLSLLPFKQPTNMPQITIGVQTSDIIRLLYTTDNISDEMHSDFNTKPQLTIIRRLKVEQDVIRKERSTQTSSNYYPSELDLLLALFPEEAPADLLHVLQTAGIEMAIRVFREIGAKMDVFAYPEEGGVSYEGISLSETFKCERIESTALEVNDATLALSRSDTIVETSSIPNVEVTSKPIKNGFYRMELSVDMIRKLSELFGDGEVKDDNTAFVDLPLWQWRQIYQAWRGLPITGRHGEAFTYDDFDDEFPDILKTSDGDGEHPEEAICLDISRNEEVDKMKTMGERRKMDTAARLQLNQLYEKFANVDRSRIDECFKDNNYSSEATEATLAMFVDDELTQSSVVLSSSSLRGFDNAGNEIGEMDQVDLLSVQQEAMTLQEEIEHCLKKKKELYSKAREVKDPRVKQFYVLEAQNFDRRAKEYSANANKRLADANTAENFVDLHFMDVSSALKLLKNKLTIIDRPENMRNGRSGRKMIVVTGYGKSANGYCKLKRAVLQWLKQCGYEYHLSANQGEIVVEAK